MEYIELTYSERLEGRKALIQSEISLLEAAKHAEGYKKLRAQEFALKTQLKQLISIAHEKLRALEAGMPHVKEPKERADEAVPIKKRKDLELEIEALKEKLSLLSG